MPEKEEISPMELEALASHGDSRGQRASPSNSQIPSSSSEKLLLLIKLYFEFYPRLMLSGTALIIALILWAWSPWQTWGKNLSRNHMLRDYTTLSNNFQFQTAQIDHWCLFGGDDKCYCEDPTESTARDELSGWVTAHIRNKKLIEEAMDTERIDVVFLGDQTVQAWDGRWVDKPAPEGDKIAQIFNDTFNSETAELRGVALGIYGDRLNNILWRMQHGEMPDTLDPEVIWLVMGTNDLALGMCSEEVVTLGIMRVAEEAHHVFPNAVVVIQGILPRTHHRDGSLEGKEGAHHYAEHPSNKKHLFFHGRNKKEGTDGNMDLFEPVVPGGRRQLEESSSNAAKEEFLNQGLTNQQRNLDEGGDDDDNGDDDADDDADADADDKGNNEDNDNNINTDENEGDDATDDDAAENDNKSEDSSSSTAGLIIHEHSPAITNAFTHQVEKPNTPTLTKYASAEKTFEAVEHQAPQPLYDYYLWPSIKSINKELEEFCSKHEHFVYFDAANLVLGSIGNDYYRSEHKSIIAPLMPNFVHLSALGHQVVMGAIADELERIIWDDDETNDIEKKGGTRR